MTQILKIIKKKTKAGTGSIDIVSLVDPNLAQEVSDTNGGLAASLQINGRFGASVSAVGDLNRDGFPDIAVGASSLGMSEF